MLASRKIIFWLCLIVSGISPNFPHASEVIKPFDRHEITLLNGENNEIFGWIRLAKGSSTSAYIYVVPGPLKPPYLGSDYIVMHMPIGMLDEILSILNNEHGMRIRFVEASPPMAFLESANVDTRSQSEAFLNTPK